MKLADAVKAAKRVFICGNGGSAANAIHIANDLVSVGIKAQALTGDVATLTAIANDFGYEHVFSRQIAVLGEAGDLLIALSGSGRSPNIIAALNAARAKGMVTWAIVGRERDTPAALAADKSLANGDDMQDAEQAQLYLGHKIMRLIRDGG